jgi:arabinosaccharide transport system substrate-binding protein
MATVARGSTRRRVLGSALALAGASPAMLLMGACGEGGGRPGVPGGGGRPQLEMWAFSQTRTAWQKRAFEKYYRQGDGRGTPIRYGGTFDINFLVLPFNQMHDKMMITTQAGQGGPDIVDIEIGRYSQFIKGGVVGFIPLNGPMAAFGGEAALFTGSATDPWSWRGEIHGLGNELNACAMAYRWDLYEQYGISVPITTYEDLAEAGRKLQRDTGGRVFIIDFDVGGAGYWWVMTLQQRAGYFDSDGIPAWDAPAAVRTMAYMQEGLYGPRKDGQGAWAMVPPAGPSRNAAFINGEILTLLGPSWNISGFPRQNLSQTAGKWMVQPLPLWRDVPDCAPTATWGGTGVCVPRTARYPQQALDFVLWEHFTPDAVVEDYRERQVWPTLKKAWSLPELTEAIPWFNNQPVGRLINDVAGEIPKWFNSPYWPEATDAFLRVGLVPALQQRQDPARTLPAAKQEAQRIIDFESA